MMGVYNALDDTLTNSATDQRMNCELIPHDVRQFILESIESVAYLEALLLLRSDRKGQWSCEAVANRLYIDQKQRRQSRRARV
jgi:hypothetical protein